MKTYKRLDSSTAEEIIRENKKRPWLGLHKFSRRYNVSMSAIQRLLERSTFKTVWEKVDEGYIAQRNQLDSNLAEKIIREYVENKSGFDTGPYCIRGLARQYDLSDSAVYRLLKRKSFKSVWEKIDKELIDSQQ